MLHYKTLPKHKSKRALKKYAHSKLRKDNTFTGIKVYSYTIGNYWYFTSKPKQDGTNAYSYKYALFLTRCYRQRFIDEWTRKKFLTSSLELGIMSTSSIGMVPSSQEVYDETGKC